jgi:catechol 2,3-dioxygenase-like lactoylglutathione lyase family enzyme
MKNGVQLVGLYVHDQDEALQFYVEKVGFRLHTDARNGDYRWLTVQHPDQPDFQLGLFRPQAPTVDEATAQDLNEAVAKGAMPPLVLVVEDCQKAFDAMHKRGVEFTQEPIARYGSVDASFRDPSGNGWKLFLGGDFDFAKMDKAEPSVAGHSADRHHSGELRFDGFRPDTTGDRLCPASSADFACLQRALHVPPALSGKATLPLEGIGRRATRRCMPHTSGTLRRF